MDMYFLLNKIRPKCSECPYMEKKVPTFTTLLPTYKFTSTLLDMKTFEEGILKLTKE